MWRPDNWDEIANKLEMEWCSVDPVEITAYGCGIEAGADAMLEALKAKGVRGYGKVVNGVAQAGWMVFIEDEAH